MYTVYKSHPTDSETRCLALSFMVVFLLGFYTALGAFLFQWGGFFMYGGVFFVLVVAVILGKSLIEYVYTVPHLKTMRAYPLQDNQVLMLVKEVAERFKLPPPKVYITHYEVPNAFTLGRKTNSALIITDGLLDLTYDEVKAVFAHELAHVKSNDSLVKTVASVMKTFLFFDPVTRFVYSRLYVEKEFVADERSAVVTGKPQDLISALRKIYKEVSEFGEGLPSQSVLNYSQVVYDADSLRYRQGIPSDPILRNRFIVERKMMPGSVVQERVKRLTEMGKRMRARQPKKWK
ncbi:MAG: M48 family metalloprotease [Theionarchaea archaeon]|nr:M48 family metalloprotease [Theionarchaea archaeon]